jgi:pterin-4a-carbinolamine dehydratase
LKQRHGCARANSPHSFGVEPLTREQCAPYLAEFPHWELTAARRIARRFLFRDHDTALAFANTVCALAEEI